MGKWKNQLSGLPKITVNRCFRLIGFGELKLVELHSFADASQVAYGAVCYLSLVDVNDRMHCAFLVGRSPLAHVRPMTVPRLELCAAVLAVQLKQSIREEWHIPLTKSTFWSDSTCVLQYIKKQSRRFHTFVAKGCRLFTNFWPLTSGDVYLPSSTQQMKLVEVLQCKTWSTTLNGWMVQCSYVRTKSLGQAISQMFKTNCQMTTWNWNLTFSLTA